MQTQWFLLVEWWTLDKHTETTRLRRKKPRQRRGEHTRFCEGWNSEERGKKGVVREWDRPTGPDVSATLTRRKHLNVFQRLWPSAISIAVLRFQTKKSWTFLLIKTTLYVLLLISSFLLNSRLEDTGWERPAVSSDEKSWTNYDTVFDHFPKAHDVHYCI